MILETFQILALHLGKSPVTSPVQKPLALAAKNVIKPLVYHFRTVFMEFYARNDLTLGCFLERYCFRFGL